MLCARVHYRNPHRETLPRPLSFRCRIVKIRGLSRARCTPERVHLHQRDRNHVQTCERRVRIACVKTRPHCGKPFEAKRKDQKYCKPSCKDEANNARKRAARDAIVKRDGSRCIFPTCRWQSRKGRLYVDEVNGQRVTLCGFHHAELFRRESQGSDPAPRIGTWYHGYYHISLEEAELENEEDAIHANDGGIGQLIDFLSGEKDANGEPIPHPLDCDVSERTVYTNPHSNWVPPMRSV